jgi:hypothetical protein
MNHTILLHKKVEVLIVSAGGVGTTFLMKEIGKYKTINNFSNADGFKHLPIPPISFKKNIKVIYVFGNPIEACMSLFRRQFHHTQSYKMQQYLPKQYNVAIETSIEEYAAAGKDGFFFRRHFEHWNDTYVVYPTLFLKYETLFENLGDIADFLELPESFEAEFPKKKERVSQLSNLQKNTLESLNAMYGDLERELSQLPDVFIKKGKDLKGFQSLVAKPYFLGLNKLLWKKMPLLRKVKNQLLPK